MLYAKAVFRFAIDYYDAEETPSPLPKRLTNRMMNVDFILNQAYFDESCRECPELIKPAILKPLVEATMGNFTGNKSKRHTCCVLLWAVEYENSRNNFLSTPVTAAMSKMTGFRRVTVEIEDQEVSLADSWVKADREAREAENESGSEDRYLINGEEESADEDWYSSKELQNKGITFITDVFTKQIYKALKPSLGPGEEGDMSNKPGVATSSCITFSPRVYRRQKSRTSHSAVQ